MCSNILLVFEKICILFSKTHLTHKTNSTVKHDGSGLHEKQRLISSIEQRETAVKCGVEICL